MRSALTSRTATLLIAAGVAAVDQLTKAWATTALAGSPIVVIPGLLAFRLTSNTGAAFGFFRGGGTILALVAIVAVILILRMSSRPAGLAELSALGLVLGGAIGNLIDRLVRGEGLADGAVVDWIQLPNFPTFNLADAAVTVGAGLLILGALRRS